MLGFTLLGGVLSVSAAAHMSTFVSIGNSVLVTCTIVISGVFGGCSTSAATTCYTGGSSTTAGYPGRTNTSGANTFIPKTFGGSALGAFTTTSNILT